MNTHCDVGNTYRCSCQPYYRYDGVRCRRKFKKLYQQFKNGICLSLMKLELLLLCDCCLLVCHYIYRAYLILSAKYGGQCVSTADCIEPYNACVTLGQRRVCRCDSGYEYIDMLKTCKGSIQFPSKSLPRSIVRCS